MCVESADGLGGRAGGCCVSLFRKEDLEGDLTGDLMGDLEASSPGFGGDLDASESEISADSACSILSLKAEGKSAGFFEADLDAARLAEFEEVHPMDIN